MLQFCFAFLLGLSLLVRSQGLVPPALINQVLHLQESGCLDIHLDLVKYAISGAVAGGSRALSRGLSFPFDTIKTLEQFSTKDENKTAASQPQLIAKDYFRGVVPAVVSAIPSTSLFFVIYNSLDALTLSCFQFHTPGIIDAASVPSLLLDSFFGAGAQSGALDNGPYVRFLQRVLISAVATFGSNGIKVPAELVKQNAQVSRTDITLDALLDLVDAYSDSRGVDVGGEECEENGEKAGGFRVRGRRLTWAGIGRLYQGGGAMLLREVPYNAFQMGFFYQLKETGPLSEAAAAMKGIEGAEYAALLGTVAAGLSALITQPADVMKTRMMTLELSQPQTQTSSDYTAVDEIATEKAKVKANSKSKSTIWSSTVSLWRDRGPMGFFVGLPSRLVLVSLGGAIFFGSSSYVESLMK